MNIILIYLSFAAFFPLGKTTYVSYLKGTYQFLSNPTKVCLLGFVTSYDDLILFGETFARPPQIMLFPINYYMGSNYNEFTVDIHDVTETSFYIKFRCFMNRQISNYNFKWVAVDDDRIKVITQSIDVLTTTSQTITKTHGIKNAVKGFISIFSFTFGGKQNYKINNLKITGDQVSVDYIPAAISTLTNIGFQIVVGTELVFDIVKDLSTGKITDSSPTSCINRFKSVAQLLKSDVTNARSMITELQEDPLPINTVVTLLDQKLVIL